ncbi:methionine gamma-lyase, partial [bacterium]
MAAVATAILACVKSGQTVIAQEALYGATYTFLKTVAPKYGVKTVWLTDPSVENWEAAFKQHPEAALAYAESPANPTMALVDLAGVAEVSHRHNAWLMVDNTFASPYCQRPLTLGADVSLHSTTKYLSGHGLVIGGAVISRHVDWVHKDLYGLLKVLGGSESPFDAWLANIGLKTFELRMQRHCESAMTVARYLESHAKVARVYYPGLESHPDHALARRQMHDYGGMIAFELKGGMAAGEALMNRVQTCTLAVSLGNVDSLIQHPASMTHSAVPREERLSAGITDGLVRLSVGIE